MVNEVAKLNPNVDQNKSYGEAIAQVVWSTWDKGIIGSGSLTAQQIKDTALADKENGSFSFYGEYVMIFKQSYEKF